MRPPLFAPPRAFRGGWFWVLLRQVRKRLKSLSRKLAPLVKWDALENF